MMEEARKYKSRSQPPCDACRKRRICCVRVPATPDCALCHTRKVHCTYDSIPAPKSGRAPSQRYARLRSTHKVPRPARTTETASTEGVAPSISNSAGSSNNSATLTEPTRWITQFLGLSGDQDPFVMRHCTFDTGCFKQVDWACLRVNHVGYDPAHFTVVPDIHLDARPSFYPSLDVQKTIEEDQYRMISAYLEVVHTSFPLLDAIPLSQQHKRSSVLLAAMCCVAAHFTHDCSEARRMELHQYAFTALPIERRHPRIETVEAALVYLQRHAIIHRAPTTPGLWAEMGTIVGMCHELGLNVDPSPWNITESHRNRRIRLWWGTYIFEKFCSFGLGRPSYIHDDDCNVPMLALEHFDGGDGTVPAAGKWQFIAMAALSAILSRVLKTFYTLAADQSLRDAPPNMIQLLFVTFQQQLLEFKTTHLDVLPG